MENINFENDRIEFLKQIDNFIIKNMLPDALGLAQERLKQFPQDIDAQVTAIDVLMKLGRVDEARKIVSQVEKNIAELSVVYKRLGDIDRKNGFNRDASAFYQKYISFNPHAEDANNIREIISLLEQQEFSTSGIEVSDDSIIPKPEFYTVTLSDLYIKQGHFKMAAEVLQEIVRREPANIQARAKLDTVKAAIAIKSANSLNQPVSENLVSTLSTWLENANRLKKHAT
jgi:tetratricopeptide (TPR) repeat protein